MKYSKESLDKLLARVRQESISVQHGSPSDAEIGQAQLADMASDYIPGLVEEVLELRKAAATARGELAEQEREKLSLIQGNQALAAQWMTFATKEPFAFVPYLVAVKQDEGLNKGEITTLKRTCCWDSIDKVWVRHGVSPRSILSKQVVYYAEVPAPPKPAALPQEGEAAEPGPGQELYGPADIFPGLDKCECVFEQDLTAEDQWIVDLMDLTTCCHCGGTIANNEPPAAPLEGKAAADGKEQGHE